MTDSPPTCPSIEIEVIAETLLQSTQQLLASCSASYALTTLHTPYAAGRGPFAPRCVRGTVRTDGGEAAEALTALDAQLTGAAWATLTAADGVYLNGAFVPTACASPCSAQKLGWDAALFESRST